MKLSSIFVTSIKKVLVINSRKNRNNKLLSLFLPFYKSYPSIKEHTQYFVMFLLIFLTSFTLLNKLLLYLFLLKFKQIFIRVIIFLMHACKSNKFLINIIIVILIYISDILCSFIIRMIVFSWFNIGL